VYSTEAKARAAWIVWKRKHLKIMLGVDNLSDQEILDYQNFPAQICVLTLDGKIEWPDAKNKSNVIKL